jgi:WD40 repeat protein
VGRATTEEEESKMGTLAVGGANGLIQFWKTTAKPPALQDDLDTGGAGDVPSLAVAPLFIAAAYGHGLTSIQLWRVPTLSPLKSIPNASIPVAPIAVAPDGSMLAGSDTNSNLNVWAASGTLLKSFKGFLDFTAIAFSFDSARIAGGSEAGQLSVWSVGTWALVRTLNGHDEPVSSVKFSNTAKILASGSTDETARLWNWETGAQLFKLEVKASVTCLAFSPDGTTLATGSTDNLVRLWNVANGMLQDTLAGHTNTVKAVAYSVDGLTLASGSSDQTIRLWKVADPKSTPTVIQNGSGVQSLKYLLFPPTGI